MVEEIEKGPLSQARVDRPLPRRFYKDVTVGNQLQILLDGRGFKTPMKAALILPNIAVARAVAAEWRAQEKVIDPALMPLTKLSNTAIDRVRIERGHVEGEVVSFAATDLTCYRASEPAELVVQQARHWDPVLQWAKQRLCASFLLAQGIIHRAQPEAALVGVRHWVAGLSDFDLTAVDCLTTLTGSALLALMLQDRAIQADAGWEAALVDEDFQISQWGEDFEAVARRQNRRREFDACLRLLSLLRAA